MGRAIVRNQVQQFLSSKNITNVGKIYAARPIIVDDADYDLNMSNWLWEQQGLPDSGSGAVLIVNIPSSHRERRAITGRTGDNDTFVHQVVVEVFFANTGSTDPNDTQGVQAQADHDALMDTLVVTMRSDFSMGNPQQIWSAGEFQAGVDVEQHEPFTNDPDGPTIFIVSTLRFEVWEWLAGIPTQQG